MHGERYINKTGKTAFCLRKYLHDYEVRRDRAWSNELPNCRVERLAGNHTLIECWGETGVAPNDTATVSFYGRTALNSDGTAEVMSSKWYQYKKEPPGEDPCEEFIDYAEPVASPMAQDTETRAEEVQVDAVFKHLVRGWDDETNQPVALAKTLYGSEIYFARWQEKLHEPDMTEDLWTCVNELNQPPAPPGTRKECLNDAECLLANPAYRYCGRCYDEDDPEGQCEEPFDPVQHGITWEQAKTDSLETTFVLSEYGQETDPFRLGRHRETQRLLLRHYTDLKHNYESSDYEVVQFMVRDWLIPAVSEWGLVVIALLMLAAGTIVIRRRRAMAARA
ncbi:MAG: IPTL-CTERM sorting domain-containing protein [Phycisphaerales bacterium]|nr:MAG: IPTL-CTERM sorting domain-containing protein [Phycisphaerales bacterium]